ncbi:hypothetical protein FACS189485_01890 [Spirochaetia bacterium]|nr:hypothetical protein FACS189485_01890 [Spirochaetia bacterium]
MNQLSQAIAGCSIAGKMQTITTAITGDRIGNAYKLAAAMNPMTGAMAVLNAMNPCRALDLRNPSARAMDAIGKRPSIRELVPDYSGNISHAQRGAL